MPGEAYRNCGEARLLPALHSDSGSDSCAPPDPGASWKLKEDNKING